ncbi:serine protease [Reichenbachiella sp. 5M10]|uniref:SDH family Clp fold serine proteinase n=1 Tax=Reichenbachiella sp. 5M10 TaxID=1889772 RepID=UPI000C14AD7A|nr:serine protease [Reichenbachiella sp. 5M10]PIB35698.1 serine protease [Reichenbachiella sp. 5M10]
MFQQRKDNYKKIEEKRGSKLLVYVTSDRPNIGAQISSDILSPFTEHLDKIGDVDKISLLIYTRGGNTLAAWSLVNLIRSFCKELEVIIPFNCHSAGTLISLGSNKIIMTKQATLGPIDPSVNGPLNPSIPGSPDPNSKVPVSVEFVDSYLQMAQKELGIKDEQGLSNILIDLTKHIHPLTLGQVYKSKSQIQMLAKKLLAHHEVEEQNEDEIIKFLCSESGSHDYTINRKEAKNLGLNIEKPSMELYRIIKDIYDDIEKELQMRSPFDPNILLGTSNQNSYQLRRALIESIDYGTDVFLSEGTIIRQVVQQQGGQRAIIQDNRTFEGWKRENSN